MTPKDIVEKFSHSLEQFELITGQPFDTDLTRIWEVIAPLLLQILYDETGVVHNLIGLVRPEAAYITRYGAAFLEPRRITSYDFSINDDATAIVHAHIEAAHKAKRPPLATYETAQRETTQFILAAADDTWVREIRDTETLYTDVAPKLLLFHLQAGCTVCHALDLCCCTKNAALPPRSQGHPRVYKNAQGRPKASRESQPNDRK